MKKEMLLKVLVQVKTHLFIFALLQCGFSIYAQSDSIKYDIQLMGLASSGQYAPFWLQNNQFGRVSVEPFSSNLSVGILKDFKQTNNIFDYRYSANALLTTDKNRTSLYLHELYAEARLLVFDLTLGAKEEIFGNQDSSLSMGGFLFSKNYRPIPKIYAGIRQFTPVPFTKGYFEIKGGISHGWFTDSTFMKDVLLHHKYFYFRLGGKLPVRFQYGIDHVSQWGGTSQRYGALPTGFKNFVNVFLARSGGNDALLGEQINVLGNHIISQSMKLEANAGNFQINAYWQNISEDSPLRLMWQTMNKVDGLWGLSVRNQKIPLIQGILYEFLNTTDQSGPYHDRDGIVFGGADNYLNNFIYESGWSFFSRTIGTPLITSTVYNNDGVIGIRNNRVQAHHFGIEGKYAEYQYKIMTTMSKNYGTYSYKYQTMKSATSVYIDINKRFKRFYNIEAGLMIGADFGQMYGNNTGCMITLKKRGDLFNY